jgi:hypothetical protein
LASIFPGSPSLNDIFTSNGTTWQWNGEAWTVVASDGQTFTNVITSPSSQTISADSPTDTLTIAAGTNISVSGNSSNDTLTISSTIDTQNLINTASAAAYTSACGYTNFIVDGLDTLDIEENTNLYFTNQRAIDATSSLITSASANALSQANTYSNSASANALAQANSYTNSASASLIAYTNSASASLVAYTDQEVSALQLFSNISTSPSTQLITGDSNSDTLTFIAGDNISITAASATDSITINSTGNYTNVDSISTPDYIQFDTTANTTPVTGLLGWDSVEGTLNLGLSSGKHIHLGEESVYRVRNSTGSTIQKGTALYASGVQPSGRIEVSPYVADGSVREVRFMGLATESITNGVNGFVQHFGYVTGLDTRGTSSTAISVGDETWAAGDLLYVHPTVPGKLTNVKPQHEIVVAILIIRHQSTGILFVRPTSGGHIEDIHDIKISGVANDDILLYNSASSIWVNSPKQNIINTASAAAYASASAYTDSEINSLTTSDIEEGTNLYFTNQRAINAGSATYLTQAAYASASPNFATDAELASAIVTASAAAVAYADGLTTTDVAEGTSLYFTNERAVNAGSATYILQTSQQGIINSASAAAVTAVIDGAPGALDTLNELAAALGDDQNFATSVTNSLSGKLDISTASATYLTQAAYASASPNFATDAELANKLDTSTYASASANFATDSELASAIITASAAAVAYADSLTTADVAENTNLYFTNERAVNAGSATYLTQAAYASASPNFATDTELASAIVTASAAAVAYADGLTTTDVAEGTNLYYTTARGQQTASTMFVHGNHTNVSAQYVSGEIRLTSSAAGGGGGATVAYQTTQPDTSSLDAGSLWIDSDQDAISGLLPATFTRWVKVLSASATTISGLDDNVLSLLYTPGYEKVFINGTLLVRGSDYTASTGNTVVLTVAAETTDVIEIHSYESFQIADTYTQAAADAKFFPINESRVDRWTKTYSASATTITGTDDYSESLLYTSGLESLFINGVLVDPSEYTRTSASVITPDEAILSGDVVDIISPKAFDVANTYTIGQIDAKYNNRTRWTKTYSASATVISGNDDSALPLSYTSGFEEVYLNGILLTPITDYARTSASVITLGAAVVTSDIIDVVNIQPFNVADVYTEAESDAKYLTQVSASTTYAPVAAGGLVLLNTTSFTAQSTVSIDNVFSSTYDNYKIFITSISAATEHTMYLRLRVGGSDLTTTSYIYAEQVLGSNGTSYNQTSTGATALVVGRTGSNGMGSIIIDIAQPFVAQRTTTNSLSAGDGTTTLFGGRGAGIVVNTTSYTGFTFYIGANMTGSVSIYGYKK